jgi:hypothetical protein
VNAWLVLLHKCCACMCPVGVCTVQYVGVVGILLILYRYGEVADCNLIRDKTTGKAKGFAFLAYEDQRSTTLAVDNFNGIKVCLGVITPPNCDYWCIPLLFLRAFLSRSLGVL